jgi:hypothetical protein
MASASIDQNRAKWLASAMPTTRGAGGLDARRSTTGSVFMYSGGPVACCSHHQPCVATSTTEVKYVKASDMSKIGLVQQNSLRHATTAPLPSCVTSKAQSSWRETQTRDKTHSHALSAVSGEIEINYVESARKFADIFTKPLTGPRFSFMF